MAVLPIVPHSNSDSIVMRSMILLSAVVCAVMVKRLRMRGKSDGNGYGVEGRAKPNDQPSGSLEKKSRISTTQIPNRKLVVERLS